MLGLCLIMFLNTDNARVSINVAEVAAIEDEVHATKISMSRTGLSLRTNEDYEKVLKKLKDAAADCRR